MAEEKKEEIAVIEITEEYMKERIYEIRGQRVILDSDLSEIYGYTTKAFNQQVKNNIEKFDEDFMFEIIYVFLTIFLYLLKCPQSLILSALRAFCLCGKPHISRLIFLYFPCQSWLKSW